jgi:hypothetical protein
VQGYRRGGLSDAGLVVRIALCNHAITEGTLAL